MESKQAWETGRPVFNRLPYKGYQDNEVADVLTQWVDQDHTEKKLQLENWYTNVDPDLCPDDYLDWLAYLVGLSGIYWNHLWTPVEKREFIRQSHSFLWMYRGTLQAIRKVLDILGITYAIWLDGELTLSFTLSGTFGIPKLRYYITLPLDGTTVDRNSKPWLESRRAIDGYNPCFVKAAVCYNKFYLGFSKLGEPLFK